MKNSDKILAALHNIYPGADVTVVENLPAATETVYIDGRFIGDFCLFFWDEDVYKPEIEIKVKATFKNFTDFIDNTYKNEGGVSTGIIRNAIERGLREWGEGSQPNS